jgi:hypothetical protein
MNPFYNPPPTQRQTQRFVDEFNADERLWRKLEPRRRARRKILTDLLSKKHLKTLDRLEFARNRRQDECIGFPIRAISEIRGHEFSSLRDRKNA